MGESVKEPWLSMDWKPKVEGPYLIKIRYVNQSKSQNKTVIRYRIKRWYIHTPCMGGYFTKGDVSVNATMLGWMPVPGHKY
jgi:hypothetical protein